MTDIATDLKSRFDFAALWFLECNEMMHGLEASLPDQDAKAVEILDALRDSVDAIPLSLIRTAEGLRNAWPEDFERWLVHGVQVVGFGFSPDNAAEFVETLNRTIEGHVACA